MMIFFNDPLPVKDHPREAVRMALDMRDRINELQMRWSRRGIELGAGIGLATGFATLGVVGFEERQDYAAIGTVTNLAARLCGEARHGQILISKRFLDLVGRSLCTEPVGELTLKGFHRPVSVLNVTGLRV
jgi:class 3 adenylate cyclase